MRSTAIYVVMATTYTRYAGEMAAVWPVVYRVDRAEAEAFAALCNDQADDFVRWERTSICLGEDDLPDWEERLRSRRAKLADPRLYYDWDAPSYEVEEVFDDPREGVAP